MSKTTVIHHSADYDGIFCREIARKFLPEAELIGWDYGQPQIPIPDGQIYVLDLSPDCLKDGELSRRVIWIDHHKSAIEKWGNSLPGYRIDGVAACRLAWQHFCVGPDFSKPDWKGYPTKQDFIDRKVREPLSVRLAGEYDIWDKRDPRAELFQHGLRAQELTPAIWTDLLATTPYRASIVEDLLELGKALQYAKNHENESIIRELGFTFQWEGLTFLACNAARYNSLLFTAGLKPEHDACFGFKFTGHCAGGQPCEEWSVSLYHAPGREHIDLSLIAVKHGGGGHRGACGFKAKTLPFLA